jgi:hypothetical protein
MEQAGDLLGNQKLRLYDRTSVVGLFTITFGGRRLFRYGNGGPRFVSERAGRRAALPAPLAYVSAGRLAVT